MKTQGLTDQQLIQQYKEGKQSAIETLIDRYRSRVFNYILLIVKNSDLAEDIFQDTFIKVIRSLNQGRYKDNGKFISWVLRIAHNLAIDHFRKEKQFNVVSNDDYESDIFNTNKLAEDNIEDLMISKQITEEVKKLINELPDDQREVIMLRHYAGLSFKEIAEQTNVSINTALGRMRYALMNMRKVISDKKIILTKM